MKPHELIKMVQDTNHTGYKDWKNDTAMKLYFFPLSSALFTDQEFKEFMKEDLLTIKIERLWWVIEQVAKRLQAVVNEAFKHSNTKEEIYLTVYVYGMTERDYVFDFTWNPKGAEVRVCEVCHPSFMLPRV